MNGASASHGDLVRNVTTGRIGYVVCGMNSGRVAISETSPDAASTAAWERFDIEVIGHQERLTSA